MTTNHSEQIDKIAKALVAARKSMGVVPKSAKNKFDGYWYSTLEDYVGATDVMFDYGLALVSSVYSCESMPDRPTKKGGVDYAFEVKITMKLIHESGQWLQIGGIGHGHDRSDKGIYKAITGSRKYAYACMFGLATSDDPEVARKEGGGDAVKKESKPNIKKMLASTLEEWGGIQPQDLQSAVNSIAESFGMTISKPATLDQCAEMLKRIIAVRDTKTFLQVVKGGE